MSSLFLLQSNGSKMLFNKPEKLPFQRGCLKKLLANGVKTKPQRQGKPRCRKFAQLDIEITKTTKQKKTERKQKTSNAEKAWFPDDIDMFFHHGLLNDQQVPDPTKVTLLKNAEELDHTSLQSPIRKYIPQWLTVKETPFLSEEPLSPQIPLPIPKQLQSVPETPLYN